MGAIEAVASIITRKVTAPVPFDETPVGLRRRRSMVEGLRRLEAAADAIGSADAGAPALDAITAVTLHDCRPPRFGDQPRLPPTPRLRDLAAAWNARPSFARRRPYIPG